VLAHRFGAVLGNRSRFVFLNGFRPVAHHRYRFIIADGGRKGRLKKGDVFSDSLAGRWGETLYIYERHADSVSDYFCYVFSFISLF
ncbi:hypothetical protein, partial [Neisseria canis]|uniref:hypothetical protein n=1 Tax=Neisseria canis TaxID=493 RepID=UPI0027E1523E